MSTEQFTSSYKVGLRISTLTGHNHNNSQQHQYVSITEQPKTELIWHLSGTEGLCTELNPSGILLKNISLTHNPFLLKDVGLFIILFSFQFQCKSLAWCLKIGTTMLTEFSLLISRLIRDTNCINLYILIMQLCWRFYRNRAFFPKNILTHIQQKRTMHSMFWLTEVYRTR